MPDLIQVANDLKSMPDNWLAQQMQSPSGEVPPWLVASEVQRRQKLRSGSAQAQAPKSSVSQDLIKSLYAKIPPMTGLMPQTPPGMPPVNLTPGGSGGALGSPPPGAPSASLRMPAKMAAGGEVDDGSEESDATAPAPTTHAALPDIDTLVQQASARYSLDPSVIRSQIQSESSGDARAKSPKGARGLMQIIPDTGAQYGVKDPEQLYDPATNIDVGAHYISDLLKKYNDLPKALAAYNAGPGAVDRHGGQIPPYRETISYVNQTMTTINALRKQNGLPPLDQLPDDIRGRIMPQAGTPAPSEAAGARAAQATAQNLSRRDYGPGANLGGGPAPANTTQQVLSDVADQSHGQLPSTMQSRLLQPQRQAPVSSAPVPSTATQPAADENAVDPDAAAIAAEVIGSPAAANAGASAAPAAAAPAKGAAELQDIADAKATLAAFQKGHVPLDERVQGYFKAENIKTLKSAAEMIFGPRQDYSKYQNAIDQVMQMAQQRMHPSIGDSLIAFGTALMANPSHRFGMALGQANQAAYQHLLAQQEQGTKDYLEAARAGVSLQEKADQYTEKIGQYTMQRLGAQQTGAMQDERAWQTHLGQLEKQVVSAQSAYNKALAKAPTKAPPVQDQLMASAIATTAQKYNIALPADHAPAVTDLPIQYQQEAKNMYANDAAQRTVAAQTNIANAATKDLDPNYIGFYMAQHGGAAPPGMSRSPLMVARVLNIGTDWLKANGYGPQAAALEGSRIKSNQAALVPLTKLYNTTEAFSKMTELNMNMLEQAMAKIPDYGAPVMNRPLRDIAVQWKGDRNVAGFHGVLKSVQNEVGKVLSSAQAAGAITESEKGDIQKILGDDATPGMIRSVLGYWRQEMANRRKTYGQAVEELAGRTVFGQTGPNAPAAGGGGQYRNLQKNGNITIGVGPDNKWHNVATGELFQ